MMTALHCTHRHHRHHHRHRHHRHHRRRHHHHHPCDPYHCQCQHSSNCIQATHCIVVPCTCITQSSLRTYTAVTFVTNHQNHDHDEDICIKYPRAHRVQHCGLSQCQSSDCIRFAHYHYHRHLHCHCHLHQGRHHHIMMLLSMLMMLMLMMLILIAFALLDCFPWLKCHQQQRSGKVQPKHNIAGKFQI